VLGIEPNGNVCGVNGWRVWDWELGKLDSLLSQAGKWARDIPTWQNSRLIYFDSSNFEYKQKKIIFRLK
jgi:hypothetical protein